MFSMEPFNNLILQTYLEDTYAFETDYVATNTLKGSVELVKLDFITHNYSLVNPLLFIQSIRLASLKDIAAMKLNAIAHNGTRYKDFIDIYFLLQTFSLSEMIEAYVTKYPKSNPIIALKGLGYFEEINFEFDKPVLSNTLHFHLVKDRITKAIMNPEKRF
jgi:Nucleotidyl transferase AbiEii toxin, Type IV TA system